MKAGKNPAASVKARLLNLAHAQKADFQQLLMRYAIERLLYRLEQSPYKDRFVLKGAMLFHIWLDQQDLRVTKDLDLLSFGPNGPEKLKGVFAEICRLELSEPDGLIFDVDKLQAAKIKEGQKYGGARLSLPAYLEKTRIALQIDVGFGDAITPEPRRQSFPVVLDGSPSPVLLTYPKETVVAEKFQAIVSLGIQNTRMKDFYDLYLLSELLEFQGELLCQALKATFGRRETSLPEISPLAFTTTFTEETLKLQQWNAFSRRLKQSLAMTHVVERLENFIMPPSKAVAAGGSMKAIWLPEKGWIS
ncbi:MAG: nucleotidyl transferase AbiEii/AbiGii toxin family protein [Candidatus Sericytochromatia bacterium]|nr:nucleotidyl transferase AbiEii/AbiGii toxin family protein [Candidatus Sericytochromatia bacterium]